MTIEEVCTYARENHLPQRKIDELLAELHPNEAGELSLEESIQSVATINYIVDTRENIKALLQAGRELRNKRLKDMEKGK